MNDKQMKKLKEEARGNEKVIRSAQRQMDRTGFQFKQEEQKLIADIKRLAKAGQKDAAAILAKQLVNLREQEKKNLIANTRLTSLNTQTKMMVSNAAVASAVGKTAQTMSKVNKLVSPQEIAQTMREFEKANAQMEMSEEMVSDALDDLFDVDEGEQEGVVQQVLDELGIEVNAQMAAAPSAPRGIASASAASTSNRDADDIEKMLAQLRS